MRCTETIQPVLIHAFRGISPGYRKKNQALDHQVVLIPSVFIGQLLLLLLLLLHPFVPKILVIQRNTKPLLSVIVITRLFLDKMVCRKISHLNKLLSINRVFFVI
ncbi:unnamed protein product [Trichobilharzia regenti]|nr:unnamed protein product [Trichobilharzia regenti]